MPETSPISARSLAMQLETLRQRLAAMNEAAAIAFFKLADFDRLLKSTISLCPDCLAHVPALVFTRNKQVLMRKHCERHDVSEALLESDEDFYHVSNKDRWGRRYSGKVMDFPAFSGGRSGGECGVTGDDGNFTDQMANKSCTILVEVTNACDLACPVCYSDARGDRKMPLSAFKDYIVRLIERKGDLDSVQLTGGEAVLHPEFWDMVTFLHAQRVKKIYLPTNGVAFASAETAERLAPFRDKLMVLLQFDGQRADTNRALRDANTMRIRDQVIGNFGRLDIHMQLTMTISLGVNDHEIGWVVDTGCVMRM